MKILSLLISTILAIIVGVISITSIYSYTHNQGNDTLQQLGSFLGKRTWRVLLLAELNVVLISWFLFSFIQETPAGILIENPFELVLRMFILYSIFSTLVVLIKRGHIKAPYRTIKDTVEWLEHEVETADDKVTAIENILLRVKENNSIPTDNLRQLLERLALREDEVGNIAKEYLSLLP